MLLRIFTDNINLAIGRTKMKEDDYSTKHGFTGQWRSLTATMTSENNVSQVAAYKCPNDRLSALIQTQAMRP